MNEWSQVKWNGNETRKGTARGPENYCCKSAEESSLTRDPFLSSPALIHPTYKKGKRVNCLVSCSVESNGEQDTGFHILLRSSAMNADAY